MAEAVTPPQRAAGILFVDRQGRVLLLHRTDGQGWAFPGGGIEDGESAEEAARRECEEETGERYTGKLRLWTRRIRVDGGAASCVDFTTFLAAGIEPFTPTLNAEHDQAEWVDRLQALAREDLHPGVRIALQKFDLDELGIARALRDGELAGPQRFDKFLLIALRITGTGASYRPQIKEFVWRDPAYYLNEDFLERCQGLPIILEHPKDGDTLDSKEFHRRIVGTVMLPYTRENAVWGIARIYDEPVIHMLETEQLSTSPMVESGGTPFQMKDGAHLLIEGKPELLDSLAIVPLGVWDKGGPPTGVANDQSPEGPEAGRSSSSLGDTDMAEKAEEKDRKADAAGVEGSQDGDKLDKVLAHLDSLHKRHDALESSLAQLHQKHEDHARRLDALEEEPEKEEEEERENKNREEEGEPTPLAADASEEGAGHEKPDGHEGSESAALSEERKENGLKAKDGAEEGAEPHEEARGDAAYKRGDLEGYMEGGTFHPIRGSKGYKKKKAGDAAGSEIAALRQRIDELNRRIPVELTDEDRTRFVKAQQRADQLFYAFGDAAGAPRWLNGESLSQYRRRLVQNFKKHSAEWKDVDLSKLPDDVLALAETRIFADAWEAARRPSADANTGVLREVIETDRTGRRISKFYGDTAACWEAFRQPVRYLAGINIQKR